MSNNLHFEKPALMNDGRHYTAFDPACRINNAIQVKNGLTSNYAYRQYLIKNATNLMKTNQLIACDDVGPCLGHFNTNHSSATPHLFKNFHDGKRPYGYETSDLKQLYLSRAQHEAKLLRKA